MLILGNPVKSANAACSDLKIDPVYPKLEEKQHFPIFQLPWGSCVISASILSPGIQVHCCAGGFHPGLMEWQGKWGLLSTAVVPWTRAGKAGCSICKQMRSGIENVTITAVQIQRLDPLKEAPVRVGKAGSERVMLNLSVPGQVLPGM